MNDEQMLTMDTLRATPKKISISLSELTRLRPLLIEAKRKTADSRTDLEQSVNCATMAAYAAGAIAGKNQAERDLQVAAYLRADQDVCEATRIQREAELVETNLALRVEALENGVKAEVYQLQAAQSAAALHVALLGYETAAMNAGLLPRDLVAAKAADAEQEQRQALRDAAVQAPMVSGDGAALLRR